MRCICLFLLSVLAVTMAAKNTTIEEKLKADSELSEFYALLERNRIASNILAYRHVTLFAPTNKAFQKFQGNIDESLVLYHITNQPMLINQLVNPIISELDGNPPVWVTRKRKQFQEDDIYINNAQIIKHRSNVISINENMKKQVLHVIDEVLEPLMASPTAETILYNPDAYQFLFQSEIFDVAQHRVRSFRQKVNQNRKDYVFKADGRHTFFIPVDEGFKPPPRPDMIDNKVIDGHVIPNHVLFTNPTQNDDPQQTLAFGDNLQVVVSFSKQDDAAKTYVKSNTLIGDPSHASGVVLAEIVKGNIPVKNGVLHLIKRPLMVVDTNVTQFLEDKEDGPLFEFYKAIVDIGGDFFKKINNLRDMTLFAPSNEAWKDQNLRNIIRDKVRLNEILNLHLVKERLPMERIMQSNMNQIFQIPTASDRKSLYFNVINIGDNRTLTVEGGGVNATVITPNIAATNGIVHIIDRVLGVPYTTVYEKLKTDPMLNSTFVLGNRRDFNIQLNDTTRRFTYFVPRDKAWQLAETNYPTGHKKLFMPEFAYHTKQILERHLVVADRAYTMADLKLMANDTVILPTIRDSLKLRIKEVAKNFSSAVEKHTHHHSPVHQPGYYVEWSGEWIQVFRPDVECTNGIIHVIDKPFFRDNDVQSSDASLKTVWPHILTILIVKCFLL